MSSDQAMPIESSSPFGFVYILTNSWMPDVVKIGQTERHPSARARELSDPTGVPIPFEVASYFEVADRFQAEASVHESLNAFRVSPVREFFTIGPAAAIDLVATLVGSDARVPEPATSQGDIGARKPSDFCGGCSRIKVMCTCRNYRPHPSVR